MLFSANAGFEISPIGILDTTFVVRFLPGVQKSGLTFAWVQKVSLQKSCKVDQFPEDWVICALLTLHHCSDRIGSLR